MKDDKGRQVSYDMFQNGGPDYDGDGLINGDELVWDSIYDNSNRPFNHKYGWVMISNPVQWNYPYWAQGLLKKNLPEDLSYSDYEASIKRLVQKQISGNRLDAIKYAINNYDNKSEHDGYGYFENDCANFVSQCLCEGGINQTKDWYSRSEEYPFYDPRGWGGDLDIVVSESWTRVEELTDYVKNTLGFHDEIVNNREAIHKYAKTGAVKPGDVVFLRNSHAVFITDVDTKAGKVYYSGHTEARLNRDLDLAFDRDNNVEYGANFHIIHIVYPDEK